MFWVFIVICLMLLWGVVQKSAMNSKEAEYSYSDLYDKVQTARYRTRPSRATSCTAT